MSTVSSMTGYASVSADGIEVTAKSVNSRYLDLNLKLSGSLEQEAAKIVKQKISRGRVEVSLMAEASVCAAFSTETFEALKSQVGSVEMSLSQEVLAELVKASIKQVSVALDESKVVGAISDAVERLAKDRLREGGELVEVLKSYLDEMTCALGRLQKASKALPALIKERVNEKLQLLCADERVASELAYLLEKSDFTEELARLEIHLKDAKDTLTGGGVIGRKLDFVAQELGREINTVGSKSSTGDISQEVVNFKSLLEKFREQVQNIE